MSRPIRGLSEWEHKILGALVALPTNNPLIYNAEKVPPKGWVTSASVKDYLKADSLRTRTTLKNLAQEGFVKAENYAGAEVYLISRLGQSVLLGKPETEIPIESITWTGVIKPVQVQQVISILSEMEDICETMIDNQARYQILGLIRAIQLLIDLPDPPRQGIVELARDPAFSGFVQVAACLAAIVAAFKA